MKSSERGKSEIVRYSKSKPDDFLRAKYEQYDGRFWTDRLPADSALKRKATQTTRAVLGSL